MRGGLVTAWILAVLSRSGLLYFIAVAMLSPPFMSCTVFLLASLGGFLDVSSSEECLLEFVCALLEELRDLRSDVVS